MSAITEVTGTAASVVVKGGKLAQLAPVIGDFGGAALILGGRAIQAGGEVADGNGARAAETITVGAGEAALAAVAPGPLDLAVNGTGATEAAIRAAIPGGDPQVKAAASGLANVQQDPGGTGAGKPQQQGGRQLQA